MAIQGMYTFIGDGSADRMGGEMNTLGDIDGDGRDDFAIYVANEDAGAVLDTGAFYIVTAAAIEAADLADGTADFNIIMGNLRGLNGSYEIVGDKAGDGGSTSANVFTGLYASATGLGDIDGDGLDDFSILQRFGDGTSTNGGLNVGEAWIIRSNTLPTMDATGGTDGLISTTEILSGSGNYLIQGNSAKLDSFGELNALQAVDDMDGDGIKEIMIQSVGAFANPYANTSTPRSAVYLFASGSMAAADANDGVVDNVISSTATVNVPGNYRFGDSGVGGLGHFGDATSGDFNGDGVTDFLMIARRWNQDRGQAYVIDGTKLETLDLANGIDDNYIDVASLASLGAGYQLQHTVLSNYFGFRGRFINDFDGDGLDDFVFGTTSSGSTVFITSSADLAAADSATAGGVNNIANPIALKSVAGSKSYEITGLVSQSELYGVGDYDGDGLEDILIGVGGPPSASYLISAQSLEAADLADGLNNNSITLANLMAQSGNWTFYTESPNGNALSSGIFVAPAGDVDGDGIPDFLISDYNANALSGAATSPGRVYLTYGKDLAILDGFDTNGGAAPIDGRIMLGAQVCFTRGSMIATDRGEIAVEELRAGDLVMTMDRGLQPIRWIGSRGLTEANLEANPKLAPVTIKAGAMGRGLPNQDLRVSPQHRMLLVSRIVERMTGEAEILTPAIKLVGMDGITQEIAGAVEYFHILFDRHEVIYANGTPAESLYTGAGAMGALSDEARAEIFAIFPELADEMPTMARLQARLSVDNNDAIERLYARLVRNDRQLIEM